MNEFYILIAVILTAAFAPPLFVVAMNAGRSVAWNAVAASSPANQLLAFNAALAREAGKCYPVEGNGNHFSPGSIVGFNASLFDQNNFSEEMTGYALGYKDPNDIGETLEFIAPSTPSPRKPEYATFSSAEEFLSDGASDDLRAIGADFPTVRYDSEKVIKKLQNRGLAIDVDIDDTLDDPGWRERTVARLMRRLQRNSLRRGVTLLSAAAVNTAKTWSVAAGKNPDADVRGDLITSADLSGIRPNRILYGDTAFDYRAASFEAQDNAGGYAGASRNEAQIASFLNVDGVHCSRERYSVDAGDTTLAQILANKVLMFTAYADAGLEDPSNIKRLVGNVSSEGGGGQFGVYERLVGDKGYRIAVEHYELIIIPATLGVRQFTVSSS